jgi:two-component system response regulator VicR
LGFQENVTDSKIKKESNSQDPFFMSQIILWDTGLEQYMSIRSPNILIIDDEIDTLELLKITMERNGFNALTAANWDEVAYIIERTFIQNKTIDVIILDLMMPDRSGFDIFRSLQVVLVPLPPVIMLSAVIGLEQQIQARDLGITRYITKPTTPAKLVQTVRDLLSSKGK